MTSDRLRSKVKDGPFSIDKSSRSLLEASLAVARGQE